MNYTCTYNSPLGGITLASDGECLIGLWFDGQKYFADTLDKDYETKELPIFEQTKRWLDIYFSGQEPDFPAVSYEYNPISQGGLGDYAYDSLW